MISNKETEKKDPAVTDSASSKRLKLNERNLQSAWECTEVASADDWFEWMRNFSQELIRESPSPALRSCLGDAESAIACLLGKHQLTDLFSSGPGVLPIGARSVQRSFLLVLGGAQPAVSTEAGLVARNVVAVRLYSTRDFAAGDGFLLVAHTFN
jgi:hypothetical protein